MLGYKKQSIDYHSVRFANQTKSCGKLAGLLQELINLTQATGYTHEIANWGQFLTAFPIILSHPVPSDITGWITTVFSLYFSILLKN